MKKITFIILMMVAAICGYAQNNVITDLFNQYYDDENFTKVSVSSKMFDLFTEIEPGDKDEEMILRAISKLEGLKILAADSIGNSRKMFDDAVKKISSKGYGIHFHIWSQRRNGSRHKVHREPRAVEPSCQCG